MGVELDFLGSDGRYGHGKPTKPVNTEILYAAPVEPCRGNGRHVQGDGISVYKGFLFAYE